MSDIWKKLMNDETYQKLLQQLPENEREIAIKSLRDLVELFDRNIIDPIKKQQGK
jgi:hypothetical protein